MASDLSSNLANYKLQLQQVEAALTTDPENEELNKLKTDLQEVVELTLELMNKPAESEETEAPTEPEYTSTHAWKIGDLCLAPYTSGDGMYYEGTIDEILEDGSCTVKFSNYGNTDVTKVTALKLVDESRKEGDNPNQKFTKKDKIAAEREYKRKKAQKKAQRMKQLEEDKESEKNKWKEFSSKTFGKMGKGKTKKSIFATPEASSGRVGVGTCGVSGKPMTKFHAREKWQK